VLVVNSYHRGFTWTDQETDGILAGFRARWPRFEPYVFHLDAKRFPGPASEAAFVAVIAARRPDRPWDAVVATDDAALELVLRRRAELAGDAPIAFCGVNALDPVAAAGAPRLSGVQEQVDVGGTLAMIRTLQPDLRRLVVVLDETDTSRGIAARLQSELGGLAARPDVHLAQGLSMAEVEAVVAGLGRDEAVLLGSFVRDRLGEVHAYEEVAERVSARSGAPTYGLWEFQLGHGIVGGSLLSGARQGQRAAELAIALLDGHPPVIEAGAPPLRAVDLRLAERFGLDPDRLGPGVAIVNAPRTLWRAYREPIVLAAAAFVALLGFTVTLLAVNRRLVLARLALRHEEEERQRLRVRLEETQRLEAVGRLAGGIAHDLNNLLTPILVCAKLVKEQLPSGHEAVADLDTMTRAAERARELTRQILAFSRRQRLDLRVIDLNAEVRTFHGLLPRLIGEDVKVRLSLAPGPLPVRGDPSQLQQVLMNLAVNARDAMPDGGVLELATSSEAGGPAVLTVRDSGTGMTEEVKARVFEPFFTTKGVGKGTGLGLSTSHGIVKQHDGEIDVESAPGRGTTFRIALPRAEPEPPLETPVPRAERGGSGTVLLVEDEALVRQLARRVLTGAGYAVVEAEDGIGAVALARRLGGIDLLLTDVVMPGMGGRELRDRLRREHPELAVLLMSGYPAAPGSGADVGWDAGEVMLAKPFTPDELLAKVRQVLAEAGARQGTAARA
jgi:signal transduction histidine kinase/ActR/RegA family two-component response regulator